jgi:SAM-dependent methyltransferase
VDCAEVRKLAELEDRHWWYAERRRILARLVRQVPSESWAADVGAAGGGNTRVLTGAGLRSVAVEYGEEGASIAQGRGLRTVRADASRLPFRDRSLELVVAFDVLEHLEDDEAAAAELTRVLKPNGRALVAVPADPALWSAHDEAVGHQRRYTRSQLDELLTTAGLSIDRLWSWNVMLRPLVKLRRRRATGSDLEEPSRLVNGALRCVVAAERVLPVAALPGVTLMADARRPAAE